MHAALRKKTSPLLLFSLLFFSISGCCLLPPLLESLIPIEWVIGPRPMFHVLNTEEIRSIVPLPNWHSGLSLSDDYGRTAYFDEELNLIVLTISAGEDQQDSLDWPICRSERAVFFSDRPHEFTVPLQHNRLLAYTQGKCVVVLTLPDSGTVKIINDFFNTERYHQPCDFQEILNRQRLSAELPRGFRKDIE